jgi:predicted MFS family arabinose efflux permease
MGGSVGYAIMVIIAGYIVKQNPAMEFVLGFLGYMALLYFVQRLPKDKPANKPSRHTTHALPASQENKSTRSVGGIKKPGLFHIFESGQIYFMLFFALISQIGLTFNYSFLGVYMTKLDYSEGMIGLMNCVAAISEIPILLLINRLIRRVEPIKLIAFASLLMGLRILMITKEGIGFFIFAQSMNGLTYMIIYFCCAIFISRNVRPVNQSKGQSALTIVQAGIGSIVGNLVGGYLTNTFGIQMAYRYIAALILGVSAIIAIIQIFCCHKEAEATKD